MPAKTNPRDQPIMIPKSTLETIDRALYEWVTESMVISATYPDGWRQVPVLWAGAERTFQSKNDVKLRDSNGNINLPVMTVERTSVNKEKKGLIIAILPLTPKGARPTRSL